MQMGLIKINLTIIFFIWLFLITLIWLEKIKYLFC